MMMRSTWSIAGRLAPRRWSLSLAGPVALIAVLAAGCAPQVRSVRFDGAPEPRPADHPIAIFSSRLPECPYEELGLVRARKSPAAIATDMSTILEAMRRRAREMGGDGIVGIGHGGGTEPAGAGRGISLEPSDGLSGTVIRFADPACMKE